MNIPVELASKILAGGIFDKRWISLSRVHSAIFVLNGEDLSPERYEMDCENLRQKVLIAQPTRFARFMTRVIIVPVYCAKEFPQPVLDYLYKRHRININNTNIYPICFNSINMVIISKEAAQNDNLLIYQFLEELFKQGEMQARSFFNETTGE